MPALTPVGSGYHYPLGTDPITGGAQQIKALADDIDRKSGTGASGKVADLALGGAAAASKSVTFPSGRFTSNPRVICTCSHSNYIGNANTVTPTGFTAWAAQYQAGAASVTTHIFWIARLG